jgi:hypothetical protein
LTRRKPRAQRRWTKRRKKRTMFLRRRLPPAEARLLGKQALEEREARREPSQG